MAVKYHCRKCGKRFVEWGAEKLGFKCPDCENEELVRVGVADEKVVRKPSLKRRPRRVVSAVSTMDDEGIGTDIEDIEMEDQEEEETVFLASDDDAEPVGFDLEGVIPVDSIVGGEGAELDIPDEFGEAAAPLADETLEEPIDDSEPWSE